MVVLGWEFHLWDTCSSMKVHLPAYFISLCPKKSFTLSGHGNICVYMKVIIIRLPALCGCWISGDKLKAEYSICSYSRIFFFFFFSSLWWKQHAPSSCRRLRLSLSTLPSIILQAKQNPDAATRRPCSGAVPVLQPVCTVLGYSMLSLNLQIAWNKTGEGFTGMSLYISDFFEQWAVGITCVYSHRYLITHQLKPEESAKMLQRSFGIFPSSDVSCSWKAEPAPCCFLSSIFFFFFFLPPPPLYLP